MSQKIPHSIFEMRINSILQGGQLGPSSNRLEGEQLAPENCGTLKIPEMDKSGISEPVVFDYGHTHKSLKSPYSRQAVQDRLTSDIDIQSTNSEYRSESSISLSGQFSNQSNQSSSFYESQKKGTSIANMPKSILKKRIPTISSDTGSAMFDVLSPMSQDLVVAKRPVSGCSRKNIVPVDLDGHFGSSSVNKSLPVASTSTKVTHAPSKPTIAYPMHLYTNQADNIQQIEPIASKMISPTTKMKRKRGSYYSSLTVPVTSSEETLYAGMGQNKQQLQTKRSDSLSLIGLAYDELPSTESAVPSASKYRLVEENQSTYSKLPFYQTSNSSAITIAPVQPASVCRSIEQDPTLSPSSQIYGVPVIDENSQMSTFVASTYGTPAQMPSQMPVYTQPQVTSPPLVQMPVYSTSRVSPITPSVTNEHIYGSVPPPYEYAKMVATAPKYQTLKASGKDIYSQSAYSSNYESAVQKELSSLNSDAISYFVRAIRSRERRNYFGSRQAIRCTRAGSIDRSRNQSSRSNSRERRRSRSRKRNVRSHSRGQRSESRDRISESKSRHSDNKSQSQTGRISRTHLSRSNAKKKVTDSKSKNSKSSDSAGQTDKSKVASKDSDSKTDKSKAASKEGGSKIDDKSKAASKDSGSKTDKSEAASKDGGVINDKGQISSKDSDSKVDKKKVPSKEDIKKAFPGRVAHIVPEEKETDVRIQINLLNKGKTPEEASKTKENKDASEVIKSRPELSEMAKQLIAKVEAKKQKEIVAKKVSHNETKKTEQIVDRCVQISKMESSPTPIKKTAEKNIQTDSELSSVCPMEPGLKKETEDELINSCTWISELKSKMHRIPENFFSKVYEDCLQDVADTMARDIPLGWVLVQHVTGTPVYMHTETKVCCVTKPYFIGSNVPEIHNIPVSAVPCLQYRENLDKHLFDKYQSLRITTPPPTPPPPPPPPKVEIKENKVETKSKILCPSSSHQPQSKDRNRGKSTGSKTRTRSRSAHQDGRGHTAKSSSRTDNAGHCGNHSLGQNKDSGTSVRSQSSDLGKDSSRKCGHSCDKDEQESSSSRGQKQKRDQNSSKRESSFRGGNLQDRSRYRHNSTDRKSDNSSMHVQDQNLSTSSSHRPVCVGSRDGNRRSEAGDQWKPRGRQTSMLSNTSSSEKKKCEKEKSKKSENITSVVAKYIADMEDVSSDEIADVSDGYDVEDISSDELEEDFESEMLAAFGAYQDELGEGYCFISDEDMEVNATEKSDSKVDGKADEIEREVKQKEGTDNTKNAEKDKNVDTTKKILGEKHFPATDDKDSLASNRKLSVSSRAKVPCKQSVVEVSSVVSKDCPAEKDVKTESKVITANSETKDSKQVTESSKIKSSLIETETFSFAKPLDLKQTTESSEAKSTSIETKPNYLIENEHKVDKSTEDEAVSVKKPVTRMATRATKLSIGPAKTIVVTRARKTQKALTTPGDISNSTSVPSADQEITETPELKTTAKVTMISVEHSTEPTESLSIEGTHKITQSAPTKKSLTLVVKSTQPADKATAVVQHDDNTTIDESQISSDTSSKSVEEIGVKRKPKQCDGQTVEATEQVSAAPKPSATPRKTTTAQAVTTLNPTVGTTAAAETNQGDIQTKTTRKEAPTTPKPAVDNVAAIKTNQSDIDTNTTPKPEVSTAAVVAKTNQVDIQTKTTHKEAPTTPKPAVDNVAAIKTNQSDIDTNTTLKPEVSTAAVVAKTHQGDIQTKTTPKQAPTTPKPVVGTSTAAAEMSQGDIQTQRTLKQAPTTPKLVVGTTAAKTNQGDVPTKTTPKPVVITTAACDTNQVDVQTKRPAKQASNTSKPAVGTTEMFKTNKSEAQGLKTCKEIPTIPTTAEATGTNSEAQTGKKHSSDLIKTAKPEDVQATRTTPTKTVLAAVGNKLAQMLTQSVKTSNLKSDPGDSKPKQTESSQNYGAATNVISHGEESTTNSDPAQPAQGVTCTESVKEEQCIKGESIVEDKVLDLPVFDHEFLKRYNARLFLFHDEVLPQRLFWNNRQLLLQLRKKLEEKKKPEEVKEDPKPEVKPESGIVIEPMEGIETQSVLQSKVEVKKEIKVEPNTEAKEETKTELEHKEEKKQKDPLSDVLKKYVKENMSGVAVHFLIQNKNNEVSCSTIFGSQVQATETASTGEKAKERAAYATLCQVLPEEYKKEEMERFFNPAPTEPPESPSDAGKAVVLKSQLTRSETASSDIKAQKRVGSPLAVPPAKVIKSDETEQEKLGIQKKRGTVLMDPVLKNRLSDPNVKIEKLDIEDPLVFPLCLKQNYMTPLQILTAYFEKNSISDDKVEWEFSQFDKERLPEHTLLLTVGKPVPQWSVKVSCRSKIQGKMKASTSLLKKLQEQKIYNPTHFQSYSFRSKLSPYEHFMKFIRSQNIDEDKVEWHFDMNDGKQESSMTVTVGKPIPRMHVKVSCKNKVEGKQKAAQSLLKKLHPPGLKYGFLLHMYEGTQNVKKILDLKKTGLKNLQQLILDHIFHNNIKELREKEFRNLASVPTLRDTLNKLTKLDNKICLEKSELPKLPVEVDVDSISSAMKLLEENGNVCTKFNQESGETLFENLKLQKDAQSNLERTVLAVLTRVVSLPAYNDEGYNIFELLFEARKYPGYSMVRNSAIRFCLDRLKLKNLVREDANEHFHPVPPS